MRSCGHDVHRVNDNKNENENKNDLGRKNYLQWRRRLVRGNRFLWLYDSQDTVRWKKINDIERFNFPINSPFVHRGPKIDDDKWSPTCFSTLCFQLHPQNSHFIFCSALRKGSESVLNGEINAPFVGLFAFSSQQSNFLRSIAPECLFTAGLKGRF